MYRFILLISIFAISFLSCESSTGPEGKLDVYVITRINGKTVDDYKKSQIYRDPDYPLQIVLYSSVKYKGSVLFEKLGEKKINKIANPNTYFIINTEGELFFVNNELRTYNVSNIAFAELEITSSTLKGRYGFYIIEDRDYYVLSFEAIKI